MSTIEEQFQKLKSYYHWPFGVNMLLWFSFIEHHLAPIRTFKGEEKVFSTKFFSDPLEIFQ